ncbi:MAG: DNA polymerase III subunit delta [Gemmatimonas sp.]|nr:DNA polymerase III subunit delta [Gemmatimonas sp.]
MPQLSIPKVLERLRANPPSATVFLHGREEFLREESLQQVLTVVLDPSTRDFNFDQLRGSAADPETLASTLATPPTVAAYRLVVVRDAQGLTPKCRGVVEDFLKNPSPGTILILSGTIPSGSKARFYRTLREETLSVELASLDAADLPGWLVTRGSEVHGAEVEIEAARAMATAIGSQLGILATELDKVAAYADGRGRITVEDVRAVGGYVPRVDRWAWFDSVGDRRFVEALSQLPDLLDAGENGVGLLIGLGAHFLKLGLLTDGGRDALERHLGPHQRWLVHRLHPQARQWTTGQIDNVLEELLRTDRLLKSAPLSDRQAMEELLLRIAAGARPTRPLQTAGAD